MVAKTVPGFFGSLTHILEPTDRAIPLDTAHILLDRLNNDGDFTTLLIQDTVGYEVVKALNFQGNLVLDRGLSGTQAKRFPVGACVTFTPSDELLKSIACETDCCENGVDETYGKAVEEEPNRLDLERLPTQMVGGINAVLGEPTGFMLINGKKIPYYE